MLRGIRCIKQREGSAAEVLTVLPRLLTLDRDRTGTDMRMPHVPPLCYREMEETTGMKSTDSEGVPRMLTRMVFPLCQSNAFTGAKVHDRFVANYEEVLYAKSTVGSDHVDLQSTLNVRSTKGYTYAGLRGNCAEAETVLVRVSSDNIATFKSKKREGDGNEKMPLVMIMTDVLMRSYVAIAPKSASEDYELFYGFCDSVHLQHLESFFRPVAVRSVDMVSKMLDVSWLPHEVPGFIKIAGPVDPPVVLEGSSAAAADAPVRAKYCVTFADNTKYDHYLASPPPPPGIWPKCQGKRKAGRLTIRKNHTKRAKVGGVVEPPAPEETGGGEASEEMPGVVEDGGVHYSTAMQAVDCDGELLFSVAGPEAEHAPHLEGLPLIDDFDWEQLNDVDCDVLSCELLHADGQVLFV